MGVVAAILMVFAVTGLGCEPPTRPMPIEQVKAPKKFDFSMTQDVTVKVTVVDGAGAMLQGALVTVGDAEAEVVGDSMADNVLARGITNDQGQFEGKVCVPARFDALRVQALVDGVAYWAKADIQNNEVSVSFSAES